MNEIQAMQFRCPECGHEYNGSEKMIGGRARCAQCRGVFIVQPVTGEAQPTNNPERREIPLPPLPADVADLIPAQEETHWFKRATAPQNPEDRQRLLRRYLSLSIWSLRIITVLGIVSGVVGLFVARSTYAGTQAMLGNLGGQQNNQLNELRDLQRELGIENLPIGDLSGSLGQILKPSPWLYYGFPVLMIVGSILMYLWGMAVIHFISLMLDLEQSTRTALAELQQSRDLPIESAT